MQKVPKADWQNRKHDLRSRERQLHLRPEQEATAEEGDNRSAGWAACVHCLVPVRRLQRLSLLGTVLPGQGTCSPEAFLGETRTGRENIMTEHGIHLRLCRSIQVEGAFGLLKNDFAFRRFLSRGKVNIRIELFLPALAFDLKKLWMKWKTAGSGPMRP